MSAVSVVRLRPLLHMIPLFQGNDDLPQWRGPAIKKKQPFSNARTLKIMHRRDVQCNTGELPQVRYSIIYFLVHYYRGSLLASFLFSRKKEN